MDRKYGFEEFNEETFQLRLKTQLKSKLFIGEYQSKRLCEQLKCYRDVIEVDKTTESEICNDLQSLIDDVAANARFCIHHVGVSKNFDENFSLWTELDEEIPFGKYWFQVRCNNKIASYINDSYTTRNFLDQNCKIPTK